MSGKTNKLLIQSANVVKGPVQYHPKSEGQPSEWMCAACNKITKLYPGTDSSVKCEDKSCYSRLLFKVRKPTPRYYLAR
jgi:DNA-directed RNA polymerase subunit RPC12/RpoP